MTASASSPAGLAAAVAGASICGALVGAAIQRCLRARATTNADLRRARLFQAMAVEAGRAGTLAETMACILAKAQDLVPCERGSLFLVDNARRELRSYVLSGAAAGEPTSPTEIRIPQSKGIAGVVSRSGRPQNIPDAYNYPHFCAYYDQQSGFHTKSVLCIPIFGGASEDAQHVIGVLQLLNRRGGDADGDGITAFSRADQDDVAELALVASVFLWQASADDFAQWADGETSVLMRRMSALQSGGVAQPPAPPAGSLSKRPRARGAAPAEVVEAYKALRLSPAQIKDLRSIARFDVLAYFNTPPAELGGGVYGRGASPADENVPSTSAAHLIKLFSAMFDDLGFASAFGLTEDARIRLGLALRDRYRAVPYHNFAHAFDVTHAVYGFLTKGGLGDVFSKTEQLALFVAAMFHDSDHPGLNNHFHLKSKHPSSLLLEATSSSGDVGSILEIHHCNVAIDVIMELAVFEGSTLSAAEVSAVWQTLIACILATDMKSHADYLTQAKAVAADGRAAAPTTLLLQLLLKTADISNVAKPFPQAQAWSRLVQEEFFAQGDAERALGLEVAPMFDRTAAAGPAASALGFVKFVALPYFDAVAEVFPTLDYVARQARANVAEWEAAK